MDEESDIENMKNELAFYSIFLFSFPIGRLRFLAFGARHGFEKKGQKLINAVGIHGEYAVVVVSGSKTVSIT